MPKIYACMAEGLEEVECLAAVDVMRRAGLDVTLASMSDRRMVTGSHHFTITADEMFDEEKALEADMIFLPGGMPGTTNLKEHEGLRRVLCAFAATEGKRLAAICAAPTVLGVNGLLEGVRATCYPGCEGELTGAILTDAQVVTDGRFTTGRGLGAALDLGLEVVRIYLGEETSTALRRKIQYR